MVRGAQDKRVTSTATEEENDFLNSDAGDFVGLCRCVRRYVPRFFS